MIIDAHSHVGTWNIPLFCGRSTSLTDAILMYKKTGTDAAIVTTTDQGSNQELIDSVRQRKSEFPFIVSLWSNPAESNIKRILETHKDIIGMLKIHPSFLKKPVNLPEFKIIFDLAKKFKLPVNIHCGKWQEVSSFKFALSVAKENPSVNFILGHMGGDSPHLIKETIDSVGDINNVYLGTESIREYWMLQEAIDTLGASRLIFGTDYNLNHPACFIELIKSLNISPEDKNHIFSDNILRLLPQSSKIILRNRFTI